MTRYADLNQLPGIGGGRRTVTKQPLKNYRGGLQVWYGQDSGLLIQNKKMRRKLS